MSQFHLGQRKRNIMNAKEHRRTDEGSTVSTEEYIIVHYTEECIIVHYSTAHYSRYKIRVGTSLPTRGASNGYYTRCDSRHNE
jgi:hypothetical protein